MWDNHLWNKRNMSQKIYMQFWRPTMNSAVRRQEIRIQTEIHLNPYKFLSDRWKANYFTINNQAIYNYN